MGNTEMEIVHVKIKIKNKTKVENGQINNRWKRLNNGTYKKHKANW